MTSHQTQHTLCNILTLEESLVYNHLSDDHIHCLCLQPQISLACTETRKSVRSWALNPATMYEWFTAALSHNAGNMAATGVNFPHLATCFAISGRSLVQHRNQAVRTAEPSLREPPRGTATWHTTSANHGRIHRRPGLIFGPLRFHVIYSLGGVHISGGTNEMT